MFPEKPKNKRKNDTQSRKGIVILFASVFFIGAIAFAIYSLPYLFPTSIELSSIQSIRILNNWTGLSQVAPISSDYRLTMQNDGWAGEATFSITPNKLKESANITIPTDKVEAFLDALEGVQLLPGPYEPYYQWTDDYPSILISLKTDQGEI